MACDWNTGRRGVTGVLGAVSIISSSGVKCGRMCFQVFGKQPPGEGGGLDGV